MSGDLIKLDVFIENAIEREIMLFVLLGQEYEPVKGDVVLVFPFESDEGEFAAIPGSFKPSSSASDFVALKQDVQSIDARTTSLETNVATHIHNVPIPSPMAPTPTTTPFVPPPIVPPPGVDPFPTTSSTIKGTDRLRATHV